MQFRGEHLRRWRHRLAVFSGCEVAATFLLVLVAGVGINLFVVQTLVVPGDLSTRRGLKGAVCYAERGHGSETCR